MTPELLTLAKDAIKRGLTRGQFIRDYSKPNDSREMLQVLSNAYSVAMRETQ